MNAKTNPGSRGVSVLAAAIAVTLVAAGCRTKPEGPGGTMPLPSEGPPFRPTTSIAKPQIAQDAQYPNLMSGSSYMIWVSDDVVNIKLAQETAELNNDLEDEVGAVADTQMVNDNFLVFELHIKSAFGDPSVAKDFTRNVSLFLADDAGRRVSPLQIYVGKASESRLEVQKEFSRTIIVLFPRYDIITGNPTVGPNAPGMRVYLEGYDTTYMFEWVRADQPERSLHDTAEDFADIAHMSFSEFCLALKTIFTNLK